MCSRTLLDGYLSHRSRFDERILSIAFLQEHPVKGWWVGKDGAQPETFSCRPWDARVCTSSYPITARMGAGPTVPTLTCNRLLGLIAHAADTTVT